VISLTIANAVGKYVDIASMFLYIVVATALVAVLRIGLVEADTKKGRLWWLLFLSACTLVFWMVALHYFSINVTDKSKLASVSREQNADCILFGYFDSHDVWHLISAIALAFALLLVLNLHPPENDSHKPFPELEPFIVPAQRFGDEAGDELKYDGENLSSSSPAPGVQLQEIRSTSSVDETQPKVDETQQTE